MGLRRETARGTEYLSLVTRLLQRIRKANPTGGLWEAADLQWWWRRPRVTDDSDQLFWIDNQGEPAAAVVFTDWGRAWGCDVIISRDDDPAMFDVAWQYALDRMADLQLAVEVVARNDDARMRGALESAGFGIDGAGGTTTWLDAAHRPVAASLPRDYRIVSRDDSGDRPHHMIRRNGKRVARRLEACSLYDPELDLAVQSPTGDTAGYALFWSDPATNVGLVEPMRTEDGYQRRGLARALLTAGLDRLAARGCTRFKVSFANDNAASRGLYLGLRFIPESSDRIYRREFGQRPGR